MDIELIFRYCSWPIAILIIIIVLKIEMNKVDKEERRKYAEVLMEEQRKLVEYWEGYLDCVNIYDIKIKKHKGYNFKK